MRLTHPSTGLVAWGNAWLTGHVGLDEAADAVERQGGPHVIAGVPGEDGELPLRRGLGALRVAGLTALRLALPAPGDPLGLTGPPDFNSAAIDVGEAVLAAAGERSLGLIPAEDRRGSSYVGTRWEVRATRHGTPDAPLLPEADHQLTLAVREATEALLAVEGGQEWRPEIAEALGALRESHRHEQVGGLAPGYAARAHRVAALASRLAVVVDLARSTETVGLSAAHLQRRTEALRTLDRAVRRARVAACNSVLDPVH
ncbi:hypothetical protein NE236_30795 [Actinoallomurus purpureus]|uniref:hypothetical protein n=1 Tax=Actinoallomurus purpureus TaxID=478114 RepID=UPI002093466E|nr:hypothetical protein [Actinoallomurus purpureus]MCO6009369.1 hypothetical protein [Actinoallomurus purpureus]